jgi:hypothetical protein
MQVVTANGIVYGGSLAGQKDYSDSGRRKKRECK